MSEKNTLLQENSRLRTEIEALKQEIAAGHTALAESQHRVRQLQQAIQRYLSTTTVGQTKGLFPK